MMHDGHVLRREPLVPCDELVLHSVQPLFSVISTSGAVLFLNQNRVAQIRLRGHKCCPLLD
jgi:hypothetical protein